MDKKSIRKEVRERLRRVDAVSRAEASEHIFGMVESLPEFCAAATVALYMPLSDEPSTLGLAARLQGCKRVVVPRVEGDDMEFCDLRPETLREGYCGIAEPSPDAVPCAVGDIDFMVVPGVAFTVDGRRLGRGKGFYDRYLSRDGFRAFTVGVCFGVQIVDSLPAEPHDRRVDKVLSY